MARSTAEDRASLAGVQPIKVPYTKLSTRDNNVYQYGDVLYSRKSANTKILQKSTDFGNTWTDLYTFTYDVGIVIVASNGNILVSQKSSSNLYVDPAGYLELSTDGGSTFNSVHTVDGGGFGVWSFDVNADVVLVAGYGKYATVTGRQVYRSTDGGATWASIFTHPLDGGGSVEQHIHKVYIDPVTPTTYYVTSGDNAPAKGVWYSTDSGNNWTAITRTHQPTQLLADSTYLYLGNDLEGTIQRIAKTDFALGDAALETAYTATTDVRGTFGKLSFYSSAIDAAGNVYFGGVAYGADSVQNNNKDAAFIVSPDQGDNWVILSQFPSQAGTTSTGVNFISKMNSRKQLYVRTNNTSAVYVLDTARIDNRLNTLLATRSAATRRDLSKVSIPNMNFDTVPSTNTAATAATLKWIDGTSGGSSAGRGYGWAIPSGGLASTASAQFDTTVKRSGVASLHLSNPTNTAAVSVSSFRNAASPEYFAIAANTSYTVKCWIKTSNVVANGAYVDFRQLTNAGAAVTTTSSNKLAGTLDWTEVTLTVTTGATSVRGAILLRLNATGNISDAWFDDLTITTARTRQSV